MRYSYDPSSALSGVSYGVGTGSLGNLGYTYDLLKRRVAVTGTFAQTNLPLPISTAAYNANNQLTQWGTATPTYDADGNMLSDGTNTFVWDARNRLVSVNMGGTSFTYDAFNRRVSKTTIAGTTSYLYDGLSPVQELTGGTVSANMLTGGTDEYFTRTDSSGTVNFLTDALGSTVALTDNAGTIAASYGYEPFGATTTNGNSSNPYQYTGRENDENGLYYYRARYYEPALGRYISEDPLGFGGGFDFYTYVAGDPVDFTDPLGLFSIEKSITQHFEADIDRDCRSHPAGACTRVGASLSCHCECTESGWKATADLQVDGDMFIYNGKFPYKGREPNDTSVHDAQSAIAHEYRVHIDPAISDVTSIIKKLESKTFKSKAQCEGACRKATKAVQNTFILSLQESMREEQMQ